MFQDTSFVISFQLTLIGIVLIGGLFLIWKAISRIEENVEMLILQSNDTMGGGVCTFKAAAESICGKKCPIEMMSADSIMQHLFQEEPVEVATEEEASNPEPTSSVIIEEPAPSETSDTGAPISRNRLRQMGVEKLKSVCEEKNIPTDGTKNQLIDRILAV